MASPGEDPIIELRGVSKRYANGTLANDGVSLAIRRGEIHAIVGENGAGKSTVMKMLFGLEQPSAGEILLEGRPVTLRSPREAIAAGIGLVPQHLELVPSFTVAENVVLGCEPVRRGFIDRRQAAQAVRHTSERFGLSVNPQALVADLSVGEQQRVEILKTLYRGAQVVLLDEPSAVLPPQETEALFNALRQLVAAGLTVVLITHKLAEVREVSDRFTVMRAGRVTGHATSRTATASEIADMIVGRPLAALQLSRPVRNQDQALVAVRDLALARADGTTPLQGVSFDIAAGEILGIAGVEGNGQASLAALLGGLEIPTAGSASLDGNVFTGLGVRGARASRVAAIPEDRLRDGVAASMSIIDNVIAAEYHQPPLSHGGWLDLGTARAKTQQILSEFGVVARSPDATIASLSGGNMQKVVLAREVSSSPRLLIASQPTRGVDIGAAQALRRQIVELADRGSAVLLFSADLDELLELSDRVAVLFRGRIAAHFGARQVGAQELGLYMTGLRQDDGAAALLDSPFTTLAEESAA
ncbi:MAG TPA: ABC transporter ATP-binding protein [Burkholderiaceae bacterium]|nr:ABC transporter ATP-binding protein [Burkholderiaceae bacterium]